MKDLETDQQETLSKMKAQHKNDVSSLQASLDKSEVHNSDLMKEVCTVCMYVYCLLCI